MMVKRFFWTACFSLLVAGCGGNSALRSQNGSDGHGNRSKAAHQAVVALKKDGIDESNFPYWKQLAPAGCDVLRRGPAAPREPAMSAAQLQREFGPLDLAFRPFFEAAGQPSDLPVLPGGATWEGFLAGFNLLAEKMGGERPVPSQWEEFISMLGGSLGQFPRWQVWYSARFASGLSLEAFLRSGTDARRLMLEHWAEADAGNYLAGSTRNIFGKAWQPKGWGSGNNREVASLGQLIAVLADPAVDPEARVRRARKVLDDLERDQTIIGNRSRPQLCEPGVQQGLQELLTVQDFSDNDREPPSAQHGARQGKRQGGRSPGGIGMP